MVERITESLNDIESRKEMPEKLLNTIRCPLNLGQVTNLMPASNYQSAKKIMEIKPDETKLSAMS